MIPWNSPINLGDVDGSPTGLKHILNTTDKIIGIAENCIDVTMNDAYENGMIEPLRLTYMRENNAQILE